MTTCARRFDEIAIARVFDEFFSNDGEVIWIARCECHHGRAPCIYGRNVISRHIVHERRVCTTEMALRTFSVRGKTIRLRDVDGRYVAHWRWQFDGWFDDGSTART